MVKMLVSFVVVFLMFYFGFKILSSLTILEKWSLTKSVAYATMCSVLAIGSLSLIVFLF